MLLEGGSGPLDSDDFYDSLSKAQREKAREQAECVKMYMHMLDLFSPDLDAHECAVRAAVLTGKYSSTTIQTWFREYCGNNSHFRQDGRGKDSPEWILDQMSGFGDDGEPETFAVLFQKWCMANLKTLSIKSATEYLTNILFKDVSPTLFSSWNIRFPISPSTAYTWMLRVGCERGHAQAGYYTDRHEAPDVVAYGKNTSVDQSNVSFECLFGCSSQPRMRQSSDSA